MIGGMNGGVLTKHKFLLRFVAARFSPFLAIQYLLFAVCRLPFAVLYVLFGFRRFVG
jgi:hypothetical protein